MNKMVMRIKIKMMLYSCKMVLYSCKMMLYSCKMMLYSCAIIGVLHIYDDDMIIDHVIVH